MVDIDRSIVEQDKYKKVKPYLIEHAQADLDVKRAMLVKEEARQKIRDVLGEDTNILNSNNDVVAEYKRVIRHVVDVVELRRLDHKLYKKYLKEQQYKILKVRK